MALERYFVIYVVTLIVVGVYWIDHHIQSHFIERANRTLIRINLAYLMIVSFLPFAAFASTRAAIYAYLLLGALHVLSGRIDHRSARDGDAAPAAAPQR